VHRHHRFGKTISGEKPNGINEAGGRLSARNPSGLGESRTLQPRRPAIRQNNFAR
jgi:hypothetical protein